MSNSDPKYNIIEGEYLLDILDQPRALEATIEGLSAPDALLPIAGQLKQGTLKRIVLTGMGSSFHALYPLHLLLTSRGCATVWAETSELIHYLPQLLDPATLIIAVSQSGRSAEILSLLDKNAGRARIIAVTNTAESPLATGADALLLTNAGEEFSVSCKTYVTALLVLSQVGALLGYADPRPIPSELEQAPPAAATYLNSWRDHVLALAAAWTTFKICSLLGAESRSLPLEPGRSPPKNPSLPAEGMSSAAFRHGPLEMVSEKTFVGVFAGTEATVGLNARLVEDIRRKGVRQS